MSDNPQINSLNQVIDLRVFVKVLLKYKWFIILVTTLSITLAILTTVFILSPQYTSSAFITLTEPIINAEFDESIQVSPTIPESQALAEVAETDEIIFKVIDRLELNDLFQTEKPNMEASLRGKSQLRLQVNNQDPGIATQIANEWALVMVERLNEIYGTGEFGLINLEIEVEDARQDWLISQQKLEDYLPESKVSVIEVELTQAKKVLTHYLGTLERNQAIILDSLNLGMRLDALDPDQVLPLGEAISLIALQQRASGEISGAEFQVQGDELLGEDYTVYEGSATLSTFINAIQEQDVQLNTELPKLRDDIIRLAGELESESHKLEILTQERNLERSSYIALSSQLEEIRITETQNGKTAKIGSEAVEPKEPSGPSILVNTVLAAIAGGSFSILAILIFEWWNINDNRKLAQ